MSRIPIILLIFLLGIAGCQTTPTQPLGNIFSPATTIPPPGTNSYTLNSAPLQETLNASNNSSGKVSPFAPSQPYSTLHGETEPTLQPFQAGASQASTEPVAAGSVKVAARAGDEIMIPVNAFRSDTGLYSSDSGTPQSSGTATETIHVVPFQ